MSISSPKILEVIRSAKNGQWNIPGFQRGFVWQRPKILLLLDSLFRGYPFGTILNWKVPEAEGQVAGRSSTLTGPTTWIIDGQQRTTALCMLTGQKPYWWKDNADWDRRFSALKPMIRLLPTADVEFQLENPVRRRSSEWFRVDPFLAQLAQVEYEEFEDVLDKHASVAANEVAKKLDIPGDVEEYVTARDEVKKRLTRLGRVLVTELPCQSINLGPVSVAEVFERVNRAGTRVRETDVTVAWVEAHNPGWVRDDFLPFCGEMDEAGWGLPPSLLIPVLVTACGQNPDLRNIPPDVWKDRVRLDDGWKEVKKAIEAVRQSLQSCGVPLGLVPSKNALFPCLIAAMGEAGTGAKEVVGRMFLAATASGRYAGSTGTKFREDASLIKRAGSFDEAVDLYVGRLAPRPAVGGGVDMRADAWRIDSDDLCASYSGAGNRYLRLLYFMTVFPNDPKAWFGGNRGRSFTQDARGVLDPDLKPEWHHFFPKAFLKKRGVEDERVNWFGNIAVVDAKANRKITSKPPLTYLELEEVHAPPDELAKQFIPSRSSLHQFDSLDDFLRERHEQLAEAMNLRLRGFGLVK
ncbi:MAG: DUF262 domain-containing protein [Gemmatimonadetes bacterium]|nr:DUF262 domain-containing protein [Gemmatimonadota bacterium]